MRDIRLNIPIRKNRALKYLKIAKYIFANKDKTMSEVAREFSITLKSLIRVVRSFGCNYYNEMKDPKFANVIEIAEEIIEKMSYLSPRDMDIIEMYNLESMPTYKEIGEKFDISRQRVHQIILKAKKLGIHLRDRRLVYGHNIARCRVCKILIEISGQSPFFTAKELASIIDVKHYAVLKHLKELRKRGLIPKNIYRLRSKRLMEVIKEYKRNPKQSISQLGRKFGYKNLSAIFLDLRKKGFSFLFNDF